METELSEKQVRITQLKKILSGSSSKINSDKQIQALLKQKAKKQSELARLKKEARKQNLPPAEPVFKTYVYAISGKKGGDIEKTLKLKRWRFRKM